MATARANLETTITADASQFSTTLRRAGMMASATAGKIQGAFGNKLKGTLLAAGTAIGAAMGVQKFASGIKGAADLGGKLSDLSARTGIAAGDLAKLGRAFEDNGVSADKIGGVVNKLQKTIYDFGSGSEKAKKPFEALGISFAQISSLNPADQFALVQQKISAIKDPATRAAIAMQIFGKSGGELLTLFADGGAITKAGSFLGSAAEILNERSGTFDEISDILSRAGEKLGTFMVGVLDGIADDLLPALQWFDQLDLAAMGQDFVATMKQAAQWTLQILDYAFQFGQYLMRGIQAAWAFLKATFTADFWIAQGELLAAALGDAMNFLKASIEAANAILLQTWFEMPNIVYNAFKFLVDPSFWEYVKNGLLDAAIKFASSLSGFLTKAFEMLKNFDFAGLKDLGKNLVDQMSKGGDFKLNIDTPQDSFKRIKEAGAKAFKDSTPMFDTSGLKKSAAERLRPLADEWREIMNQPIEKLPDKLNEVIGKIKAVGKKVAAATVGETPSERPRVFGEAARPSNRVFGQAARASGRVFGQAGEDLSLNSIFAKDRERLGIASGLPTGGIGEKRRLKTSADNKADKDAKAIQKSQEEHLSSIDSNIKQALTVA